MADKLTPRQASKAVKIWLETKGIFYRRISARMVRAELTMAEEYVSVTVQGMPDSSLIMRNDLWYFARVKGFEVEFE